MPSFFALVAASDLAAGTPITAVPQIFSAVRARVLAHGVTGVMVFDGAGFCLYLEGEQDAVLRCHRGACEDDRQSAVEILSRGSCAGRRYGGFFTGYALADGLAASEQLRAPGEPSALHRFLALSSDFDLNAPAAGTPPRRTDRR